MSESCEQNPDWRFAEAMIQTSGKKSLTMGNGNNPPFAANCFTM